MNKYINFDIAIQDMKQWQAMELLNIIGAYTYAHGLKMGGGFYDSVDASGLERIWNAIKGVFTETGIVFNEWRNNGI